MIESGRGMKSMRDASMYEDLLAASRFHSCCFYVCVSACLFISILAPRVFISLLFSRSSRAAPLRAVVSLAPVAPVCLRRCCLFGPYLVSCFDFCSSVRSFFRSLACLRVALLLATPFLPRGLLNTLEALWCHVFTYLLLGTRFFNTFFVGTSKNARR